MQNKLWSLLLLACAGCGQISAEPIQNGESALPISEPIIIPAQASSDAYACEVVQTDGTPDSVYPFLSVGTLSYGAQCQNPATATAHGCWYTGRLDCAGSGLPCGGFIANLDTASGTASVEGGQHMLCSYGCVEDSECPAPSSGTARATCMRHPEFNPATDGGTCMLGCGNGETCPDGFVCIDPSLGFGQSDGFVWSAPTQCVQYKGISASTDVTPP
jgi:hypothetical protein